MDQFIPWLVTVVDGSIYSVVSGSGWINLFRG